MRFPGGLVKCDFRWSCHFIVVRANARGTILSIACACFSLSRQRSLSSIKRSKAHGAESEESSINTHEHDAGHSINETADHFIKHICLTFLDAFFWVTHQPTQQWSMTEWYKQIKVIGFGSSPLTSLFTPLHMFLNGCAPPDGQGPASHSLMQHLLALA